MSKIEWTQQTWNPIVGCSIVSPGCTNCYAMKMAARIERMSPQLDHYKGLTKPSKAGPVWTGKVALAPEKTLLGPLKRRRPTMYFVNSMSDLFHEDVPDAWIDRVFAVMALCPQHTFQCLTKRAARMRTFVTNLHKAVTVMQERFRASPQEIANIEQAQRIAHARGERDNDLVMEFPDFAGSFAHPSFDHSAWPLSNVWLGVSCERQQEWDERTYHLSHTPAAVRFVSYEPALGPINGKVQTWPCRAAGTNCCGGNSVGEPLRGIAYCERAGADPIGKIDWVICGGESGRDARPMHPDWARSIRDQCTAAGVAFFFKQHGESIGHSCVTWDHQGAHTSQTFGKPSFEAHGERFWRVGKKAAGRLLDGHEWNEMPTIARQPGMGETQLRECLGHASARTTAEVYERRET